jgi:hypothetical protein
MVSQFGTVEVLEFVKIIFNKIIFNKIILNLYVYNINFMTEESCIVGLSAVKSKLLETTPSLNDEEIKAIYEGMMSIRKEEGMMKEGKVGGRRKKQLGGVKCDSLHTIYKYSIIVIIVGAGITCGISEKSAEMGKHFIWVLKDMFDKRHFAHAYDIIGKVSALGLGFLERLTKFLLELRKSPKDGLTMNWVKNIFEIFCQVDEGTKKLDDAKKEVTGIVVEEMIKNEQKYPVAEAIVISNDNIVYDGRKALKILIKDTIITISPAPAPAPAPADAPADDAPADDAPAEEDEYFDAIEGGRRRKIKTNRSRRKTKRRNTKRNKCKSRRRY